jgi:hypothetical protein
MRRLGHIVRKVRGLSPAEKALSAVEVGSGFTRTELHWLTGASLGYIATALAMTPEQRAAVRCGEKTLSGIHNARRALSPDQIIDRLIARFGAECVADRAVDAWWQGRASASVPAE